LSLGYFSVDELLYEFQISNDYRAAHETLNELVSRSREFASKATIYRSSEEFAFLLRKELMSRVVDRLIRTIEYEEIGLTFGQNAILARGLKNITFTLISRRPLVHLYEMMGETIIRGLFEVYTDPHFNRNRRLLPPEYRLGDEPRDHKRNVIDFIAGMMDSFAIEQYERYYGKRALRSLFEAFRDCMPRRPDMHMTVLKRVVKKKRRDPS
jgi:dGTPase